MFVTGMVLAAEGSPRIGVPRQLLAYQGTTVLDATLETARDCGFDQLLVTLGVAAEQIRERVDLDGTRVVESPHADTGSSSVVPALDAVDRRTDGLVVMLGDQPGVTSAAVWSLVAEVATPIGVTRYDDGRGHPVWFGRETFGSLRGLRSDEELWHLIDAGPHLVTDVDAIGNIPPTVRTWDDYATLVGQATSGPLDTLPVVPPAAVPTRGRAPLRPTRTGP
ncbi:molybdenum cofactor cytidylyltransferase [Kribbella amoyensis]|uniref:Molybdenum cofactor cytidylyltransferase n=1 Tax=Kribbella amoyensis TaxID=996641 RepID=A0A561B3C4_9ACTN|nr:nucleotidyltransferase family protein [Kribbella amoyensis]TWD73363.1 molybdenum cofactor cytidylyltransferase [Kribbella amoyensis]